MNSNIDTLKLCIDKTAILQKQITEKLLNTNDRSETVLEILEHLKEMARCLLIEATQYLNIIKIHEREGMF